MAESAIQDYRVSSEPYYLPVAREIELFEAAHSARLPVILKGRPAAEKPALSSTWRGDSNAR